jgi:hypothetical protein
MLDSTKEFYYLDFLRSFRFAKDLGLVKRKRQTPLDYDLSSQQKCIVRLIKDVLKERIKNSKAFTKVQLAYNSIYVYRNFNSYINKVNDNVFTYLEHEKEFIEQLRLLKSLSFNSDNLSIRPNSYRIELTINENNIFHEGLGYIYYSNSYSVLRDGIEFINNYEALYDQMEKFAQIYESAKGRYYHLQTPEVTIPVVVSVPAYMIELDMTTQTQTYTTEQNTQTNTTEQTIQTNATEQNTQSLFNSALTRWQQRRG